MRNKQPLILNRNKERHGKNGFHFPSYNQWIYNYMDWLRSLVGNSDLNDIQTTADIRYLSALSVARALHNAPEKIPYTNEVGPRFKRDETWCRQLKLKKDNLNKAVANLSRASKKFKFPKLYTPLPFQCPTYLSGFDAYEISMLKLLGLQTAQTVEWWCREVQMPASTMMDSTHHLEQLMEIWVDPKTFPDEYKKRKANKTLVQDICPAALKRWQQKSHEEGVEVLKDAIDMLEDEVDKGEKKTLDMLSAITNGSLTNEQYLDMINDVKGDMAKLSEDMVSTRNIKSRTQDIKMADLPIKKSNVSVQDVCDLFNELLEIDNKALEALINVRVKCNVNVRNHPSILVRATEDNRFYSFGIVGFINGIFGLREDGFGQMCYDQEDDGKITGFRILPKSTLPKEILKAVSVLERFFKDHPECKPDNKGEIHE